MMIFRRTRGALVAASFMIGACSGGSTGPGTTGGGGAMGGGGVNGTGGAGTTRTGGATGSGGRTGTGGAGTTGTGGGTGSGGRTGTGGAAGAIGPSAYRPFNDTSPWNTVIGPSPELDPNSQALIDDLASSTASWNYLSINLVGFSVPVYYIDSSNTPTYMVATGVAGHGFDRPVPIPNGAMPDPMSDHHMSIVDKLLGIEWGMWDTVHNGNNTWSAGVAAAADLKGSGVRPPITTANPWTDAMGARASGFPLIAGLMRVDEVKAGRIQHALILAYAHCRSRYFVPPASTAQGTTTDALPNRGIPMGGHIQFDPSVDVDALPLSASGKIIAHALQDYGAFIGDYSGAISIYAENAPDAQAAWASGGLLHAGEVSDVFNQAMLRRFRVLRLPAFLDNNN